MLDVLDGGQTREPSYGRQAVSLLDQIAERALDDDYYVVRTGRYSRSRGLNTVATAAVLGLFALMVTITAVQYYLDQPSRSQTREALAADVERGQALQAELQDQVAALEAEVDRLSGGPGATPERQAVEIATGATAVHGEGLTIAIDSPSDAEVTDGELRSLVNELWIGGAEAVAVNGHRWGALTSLRTAGGVIAVNFSSIGPPYVVEAIGDRRQMIDRFEAGGEADYWRGREETDGLVYTLREADDVTVPAAPEHRTSVRRATMAPTAEGVLP
ncbi:MAG: DUF881 domain-containing protein [Aeromicrobium sp.]|uniref:DUF881 domain-containing protein n=1 Tax=Aeromicrobium sp. TaxID=1871063 RepID=UPI0039E71B6F